MVQEIITYLIIGAAGVLATLKVIKRFARKKKKSVKNAFQKDNISMQHNCSECSAECMLRDAAAPIIQENKDLCKKIEMNSDKL